MSQSQSQTLSAFGDDDTDSKTDVETTESPDNDTTPTDSVDSDDSTLDGDTQTESEKSTDPTAAEGLPPAARDTVYEAYPEVEITAETLQAFFDADINNAFVVQELTDAYANIRSLSGAVVGMLRLHIDEEGLTEFYGTVPDDLDLTIAHRQQNEQMGVFTEPEWR